MAGRNLEELKKRYNSSAEIPGKKGPGGPGGGGGGPHGAAMRGAAKPKDTKKTIKRLFSYISAYKLKLVFVFFCLVFSTGSSLVASYMLKPVIDNIAKVGVAAEDRIKYLAITLLGLLGIYIIGVISTYLQSRTMLRISQSAIERLRNELFSKVQRLPLRFHDNENTGEIMSRFTNDVDNIGIMLDTTIVSLISGCATLIGTLGMMFIINPILTLITIIFTPLFFKAGGTIAKLSRKYYKRQQASLGALNGYIEETVTGSKVVKVFNHEDACNDEFALLNDDLRRTQMSANFFGGIMGPVMGNSSQVSYAVTAGVGGVLCTLISAATGQPYLTIGGLTVFVQAARHFSRPINEVSMQMTTVFSALAGAERVFGIMDKEPEAADAETAIDMPQMQGHVILDDVSFGYNPDRLILKNISLYAKPGQKIAFVGSTGAGKTTVTNLLNRFYDIESGKITIDGVNIKDIKRDILRSNIAMVLQDTHLFTGTVMENIRYGRLDATDEEVIAAAKTASAHSFIMRLEEGYDTVLEGDGANLSQGQRQLLNIARAAVSKAPILVLDEATSSVDTRTERHIEHGMDRLMKDRTTFVIAHRLSTVRNANAIMVLENGVIVERGDHDDLLEQKGRYYELYTGKKELD